MCIVTVGVVWDGIVLVIRQYRKSQILVRVSDEKRDCTIDCKNARTVVSISQEN